MVGEPYLLYAPEGSEVAPLVADALQTLGHSTVHAHRARGLPRQLLRAPRGAFVEAAPKVARGALALAARRVPYILFMGDGFQGHRGTSADRAAWTAAGQAASWVAVQDEQLAHELGQVLSLRQTIVLNPGVDIEQLPLGDQSEAQKALGVGPSSSVVAWIGALDGEARLDQLALAHRHLAGTTLLIVGSGPSDGMIAAMTLATRPSAPVIPIGPDTPAVSVTAGLAADVGITHEADAARRLLALGRRVVTWQGSDAEAAAEGIYEGHQMVFSAPPTADGLRAALEDALQTNRQDPLPLETIDAARASLGGRGLGQRLARILIDNLD